VSTLTPAAAREQISRGHLQPVYLIVGDDEQEISGVTGAIAGTVEDELRAFNYERIYTTDKDVTPDDVVAAARLLPMMGERRVVVLLRGEKWLKPRKVAAVDMDGDPVEDGGEPVDRSALASLAEYVKEPVPSTTLAIVASEVNRSLTAVKVLVKHAALVECYGLREADPRGGSDVVRQAIAWVREAGTSAGRQIEPAAAHMLAERSGGDIGKLRADLDHLLLFAKGRRAVTREDVEAVVSDQTALDPWAIVNAIERGDAGEALKQLGLAFDEGGVPVMILGQLAWWVREKMSARRPHDVAQAINAVFRTDQDLKSSGGDPRVLLERLVLELCGKRNR
jgi:DNA polymerase III delta subunit